MFEFGLQDGLPLPNSFPLPTRDGLRCRHPDGLRCRLPDGLRFKKHVNLRCRLGLRFRLCDGLRCGLRCRLLDGSQSRLPDGLLCLLHLLLLLHPLLHFQHEWVILSQEPSELLTDLRDLKHYRIIDVNWDGN